jgi:hypothetical protein
MMSPDLPPEISQAAERRLKGIQSFVEQLDLADPKMAFANAQQLRDRMKIRANFRSLHGED